MTNQLKQKKQTNKPILFSTLKIIVEYSTS